MQLPQGFNPGTPGRSSMKSRVRAVAPLYDPAFEHDACGVGLVVDIAGRASRDIVDRALGGLVNLTHRGGVGADARTGDGAGILTQIPLAFLAPDLERLGHGDVAPGELGVAMTFFPQDAAAAAACRPLLEAAMTEQGIDVIGWREVPIQPEMLGETAARTLPRIAQLLVRRPVGRDAKAFERDLLLARKAAERATAAAGIDGFFVVSCSARTLIYKGFCLPEDLPAFYPDLRDPSYTSAIALFHQRYSTNTLPTWAMAQPFRFIAHNGEINTVQGNRNWMMARDETGELSFADGVGGEQIRPVVSLSGSDSLSLDNTLELLYHGGRGLPTVADDARARAVGAVARPGGDGGRPPRLLRLQRRRDGAMGRSGRPRLLRRHSRRGHTRPQRSATLTLRGHLRRSVYRRIGSGHRRRRSGDRHREGSPWTRPDDPGRHRARRRSVQRRT